MKIISCLTSRARVEKVILWPKKGVLSIPKAAANMLNRDISSCKLLIGVQDGFAFIKAVDSNHESFQHAFNIRGYNSSHKVTGLSELVRELKIKSKDKITYGLEKVGGFYKLIKA